jgi:hypothetical protein
MEQIGGVARSAGKRVPDQIAGKRAVVRFYFLAIAIT